jgi:hypothetical protein
MPARSISCEAWHGLVEPRFLRVRELAALPLHAAAINLSDVARGQTFDARSSGGPIVEMF